MSKKTELTSYANFFLRSLDSILIIEKGSCKIYEANPATNKLLNLDITADESALVGVPFCSFISKRDVNNFKKEMRRCARRHHPRSFESILRLEKNGEFVIKNIKISACNVPLDDGSEVIEVVVKDITREKEIEAQLQNNLMMLEYQSNYDAGTNIPNKRNFMNQIAKEQVKFEENKTPYSLLFMDIDNFKHFNDTNGHEAGDECLKQVAQIIKDSVRTTDFPARYGGEEFVVICPETEAKEAAVVAERIREAIMTADIPHKENQPKGFVSVSIGVASIPKNGMNVDELKELADDCLYIAKEGGRNQVVISTKTYEELVKEKEAKNKKAS